MGKMLQSHPASSAELPTPDSATHRSWRRGRSHPLVACLAGGLQATYATQLDDAMPEHVANLIARLERGGLGTR